VLPNLTLSGADRFFKSAYGVEFADLRLLTEPVCWFRIGKVAASATRARALHAVGVLTFSRWQNTAHATRDTYMILPIQFGKPLEAI
jgi:hypothetical protein